MTCKAPFTYNSETGKCEMYDIIPPVHCAANDAKVNLYTLIYNKETKLCEGEDKTDPKETKKAIDFPVCVPGTTVMPDNWCKKMITSIDPKKESEFDGPPDQSNDGFLNMVMAKNAQDEVDAKKTNNNILLFLFLVFIITGIGLYFFFK
jgi:hypothetical protein